MVKERIKKMGKIIIIIITVIIKKILFSFLISSIVSCLIPDRLVKVFRVEYANSDKPQSLTQVCIYHIK